MLRWSIATCPKFKIEFLFRSSIVYNYCILYIAFSYIIDNRIIEVILYIAFSYIILNRSNRL